MKTEPRGHETEFARRLRTELRTIVAELGAEAEARRLREEAPGSVAVWRRRGPRLAASGIVLVAVVVAVLVASAGGGGTSAAWAVKPAAGDRVDVVIRDLDDARGLEGALRQAGLPVKVTYRSGANLEPCHPSAADAPVGVGILRSTKAPIHFSVARDALVPGRRLHLTAGPDLVFISFTPRAGHDGADVIGTSPAAILECRTGDHGKPLLVPRN